MAHAAARKRRTADDSPGLSARLVSIGRGFFHPAEESEPSRHAQEIKGILLIGFSLWLAISMASYYRPFHDPQADGMNWGGQLGFYLAGAAFIGAGLAGLIFALLGVCWGAILVARKEVPKASLRLFAAFAFVMGIAFLLQMGFGGAVEPDGRLPFGPGGYFALQATPFLATKLGGPGLWIVMLLLTLVSFMLATEMAFYPSLVAFREWSQRRREQRGEGLVRAVSIWTGNLVLGLWDFLRGARLGETAQGLAAAESAEPALALAIEPTPARQRKAERSKAEESPVAADDADDEIPEPELDDDDDDAAVAVRAATALDEEAELDEDEDRIPIAEDDEELDDEANVDRPDLDAGEESARDDAEVSSDESDEESDAELRPVASARGAAKSAGAPKRLAADLPFEPPTPPPGEWKLPPIELLERPDRNASLDERSLEAQARKLEAALASFRVEANVVGAQVGPTVILFELEVSQGTRMNKVTQLSQEIAAALRAQSVRIIAPIPGKATIGIEVPNAARRKVRISELVSQNAYDKKLAALPLFLGMDAEGNPIVEDLARMPHLLIAGTTGSGKSVCINTILASFLLTRSPHDVQMILIDPKMVELQMFASIPHLMLPVVTDMRQATNVLMWAVEKMEGRYELFNHASVRNIKAYNALSEEELQVRMGDQWNAERTPRHVPYIVVVIDEFADLMMASKKEAEQAITRLAQKSRAVGIHVILATQRPSTDVITGVIKGNLPTRIAFQVASKVDSRVILDSMGAEKLLGGGDMLYNPPQSSRIKRVQGALVEDHELQGLIDFVCQTSAPTFNQELVQVATGTAQPGSGDGFESALEDELWDEAVRIILKSKRGSASLLQRALGIGYTRASRLLDMMGEAGIVSDHKGSKAREVLMTLEQWEEQHGAPLEQGGKSGANDE
jgi:DNA segregation ATPase FtsK/SpoIIIE-like protein